MANGMDVLDCKTIQQRDVKSLTISDKMAEVGRLLLTGEKSSEKEIESTFNKLKLTLTKEEVDKLYGLNRRMNLSKEAHQLNIKKALLMIAKRLEKEED